MGGCGRCASPGSGTLQLVAAEVPWLPVRQWLAVFVMLGVVAFSVVDAACRKVVINCVLRLHAKNNDDRALARGRYSTSESC